MSFSAILGASSAIRAGVVTSSTRPSAPYNGQLIYETDTARLAAYNGSAWVTQNGLQLITAQTIGSAVSSVTVSNCFSATYDNYKIIISGGVSSASTTEFTTTLTGSTTGYYYGLVYNNYNATTTSLGATNAAGWLYTGAGSTNVLQFNMDLQNPFLAKYTNMQAVLNRSDIQGSISGYHAVATSYTGFTITPASGTITGGTIRVYGYANN